LLVSILIVLAACSFITGVFAFIQFGRYRMKENEKKEIYYKNLHYYALTLLAVFIVVLMFIIE
jgi:uncharacterized membrane protein YidH (DUF202 family)